MEELYARRSHCCQTNSLFPLNILSRDQQGLNQQKSNNKRTALRVI